jgi:hypothetical protein
MLQIFHIALLIGLANAGVALQANVGEPCSKDPSYNITTFSIVPYPFSATAQYSITMSGTFVDKEYVNQIYIGTRYERKDWTYTYQVINKEYAKGTSETFPLSLQAPSLKGSYTGQITLHRSDFSIISCWEYTYNLA